MRLLLVLLLLFVCSIISFDCLAGSVVLPPRYALYADFDNKTVGQPIAVRGASFAEPTTLGALDTSVIEISPGQNRLWVSNNLTSTAARRLRWSLLGTAEIEVGEVRMSFDLTASSLDKYSFLVRESVTSTSSFLNVSLNSDGSIATSDANGAIATTAGAYAANIPLHVELIFDMDARTSTVILAGNTIASGRAFGVADRGIGGLSIGYQSGSSGSVFELDNLKISAPLPFPIALEADFEDKTVGLPIGVGGAVAHEPTDVAPDMDAIVQQSMTGVRYLDMSSMNTAGTQAARWQFIDNLEVRTGLYVLDFDTVMMTRDRYRVALRERTSASQSFMNLQFQANGTISVSDANGTVFLSGVSYVAGTAYQYRVVFDLDAGIYNIYRDGVPLIRERAHGITSRGIGGILFSIDNGAAAGAHFLVDSLHVQLSKGAAISSDLEFLQEASTAIENQPVTPIFQVGAMSILDQPVPDGTPVTLEIAQGTGPSGATLGGANATTTAGIATFPTLTFDTPGTYRLVARSFDAAALNTVDIVVEQSDVLFANGFD